MAASGTAKYNVVVTGNNTVSFAQQFYLDDAITMPVNVLARHQTVMRLVSGMPTVNHVTAGAGSCSICMESFSQYSEEADNPKRQVSCGHVYHHDCITVWLLNGNSNSCPLCRHEISS